MKLGDWTKLITAIVTIVYYAIKAINKQKDE
jgi:hypothetical protein